MALLYKIDFATLHLNEYMQVQIYDNSSDSVTAAGLRGGATPIITEEDSDPDVFMPVRTQSGYINIVDDGTTLAGGAWNWKALLPDTPLAHPVALADGERSIVWKGFIQMQQPESKVQEMPAERSYAIYDVLGALEFVDFNLGISTSTTRRYVNFAYLIKCIIDTLPAVARPQYLYFQNSAYVNTKLLSKVNPMLFYEVSDAPESGSYPSIGYEENISAMQCKYSCKDVLEEVCKFWGYSCRSYRGDLYFVQDFLPSGSISGHGSFRRYSYSQISTAAGGTASGTEVFNPYNYPYDGSDSVSTDNHLSDTKPITRASVEAKVTPNKDIMKMFPDNPRAALASHVLWNGGDNLPPLRVSQNKAKEYWAGSHKYEASTTLPYYGNIFGIRSEAEKWGIGETYTYRYVAGVMFGVNVGVQSVQLLTRWPFSFTECRLSMKGMFFNQDGEEITATHDDTEKYGNIGKGYAGMTMILHCDNGTDYYWNGDRWRNSAATFGAYVGGSDGYIYFQSAAMKIDGTGYALPRKYITFETLINAYDVQPVGQLEIRFGGVTLITPGAKYGMADVTVAVERIPLPSVEDSVSEDHTYVKGLMRKPREYEEWNEDTIFASDDRNQFGIGTVLTSDNAPLTTVTMNGGATARPEQWVADMVFGFCRYRRQILCVEINRATSYISRVNPRARISAYGGEFYPFAICHYWRDDVVRIYGISIRGTQQHTITVQAGTGIASVSPAGATIAYQGNNLEVSCVPASGYFFSHWMKDGVIYTTKQNFTLNNITASTTLKAVGIANDTKYAVEIVSHAMGISSVSGAGTYNVGTVVAIRCVVASGYRFTAWTENDQNGAVISENQTLNLTVNRDITLYPLTEAEEGSDMVMYFAIVQPAWGYIEDMDYSGLRYYDGDWYEFMEGEFIRIQATPAAGYRFVKWKLGADDYSTSQELLIDFDDDIFKMNTLTAVFEEEPVVTSHTLYITGNRNGVWAKVQIDNYTARTYKFGTGSSDDAAPLTYIPVTVPVGATVKITAEQDPYYVMDFGNIFDDDYGITMSTSSPYSFTMNREYHISVNFK